MSDLDRRILEFLNNKDTRRQIRLSFFDLAVFKFKDKKIGEYYLLDERDNDELD